YSAADRSCNLRNSRSTLDGVERRASHETTIMLKEPRIKPSVGASTIPMHTSTHPRGCSAANPDFTTAAPPSPPTSACDELVGSPSSQVMMFHTIAPLSPATTT